MAVRGTASRGRRCPKNPVHKIWGSRLRSRGRTAGLRREAMTMPRIARGAPPAPPQAPPLARPLARRIARAISMGLY